MMSRNTKFTLMQGGVWPKKIDATCIRTSTSVVGACWQDVRVAGWPTPAAYKRSNVSVGREEAKMASLKSRPVCRAMACPSGGITSALG